MAACATLGAAQNDRLGTATASGTARINGQPAVGGVTLSNAARLSTDDGAIAVSLASGGELRLGKATDVVVSERNGQLRVQFINGEVTVTSTTPVTVVSPINVRVSPTSGRVSVEVAGHKPTTLKAGKTGDFYGDIMLSPKGTSSTVVITSINS